MSFIGAVKKGVTYTPGWFLAHNDETCTRETKEIAQSGATTDDQGNKYVPMGTIYPSNDGNATGIVYEDVDVTTGNMPGSVVTKGIVYEDRLAITGETYNEASPAEGDNPQAKGWYEKIEVGSQGAYIYQPTTDTTVDDQKTYYVKVYTRMSGAAKSALSALGFTFIASTPAVERPY